YFLNIKGPELLNKYVGETERKIREIFVKAKEKASEDVPVVVFFDEMDALFRTRGTGISSDVESTIVPQLLAEIDGVEGLRYAIGEKEILYFKDFACGAMIESIVRRAKKLALKRLIAGGAKGVNTDDVVAAVREEFKENEDLPNTSNPDDWAKIAGRKGERIVYVKVLTSEARAEEKAKPMQKVATGQYL